MDNKDKELRQKIELMEWSEPFAESDPDVLWSKLAPRLEKKNNTTRSFRYSLVMVAAVLLFCVSFGGYWLFRNNDYVPLANSAQKEAGQHRILLAVHPRSGTPVVTPTEEKPVATVQRIKYKRKKKDKMLSVSLNPKDQEVEEPKDSELGLISSMLSEQPGISATLTPLHNTDF